ncbi:extracellular calcium-sensing receptor-like [Hyla sarda]|uniref:extracellular calcium-sensing receptor-like n=1 Tax=Hyla sarda TaxID=327740 RepID=UPI0024C455CE|nr:extracellular calcium-sensing receptor-like [Hyla sarda]
MEQARDNWGILAIVLIKAECAEIRAKPHREGRDEVYLIVLGLVFHVYWTLWHLILSYVMPASHSDQPGCRLSGLTLSGLRESGNVLIGAILPLHFDRKYPEIDFTMSPQQGPCIMFRFEGLQQFQALRFAIEEINRSPNLLPNTTLGFQVYDSCAGLRQELDGTQMLLTGQDRGIPNYSCQEGPSMAAIIGHSVSSYSILMAHMLGLYRYPQISHYSTSSLLSDRSQFPSFFRTVPNDAFQSKGLAQLVLHFGWTWVGLIALDEDYGLQGIQVIKQELLKAGACVAFLEYILNIRQDKNAPHLTKVIQESSAKVVVVFSTDVEMVPLLNEMVKKNVTGKIFVASEAWSTSALMSNSKYSSILSGSIGFSFHSSVIPHFQQYLNNIHPLQGSGDTWVYDCQLLNKEMEAELLNYSINMCAEKEDLKSIYNSFSDVSSLRGAHNLYAAINVIAEALHDFHIYHKTIGGDKDRGTIENLKPWKLSHYIQAVRVRLTSGSEIFFNENGDPPAVYDIVYWRTDEKGIIQHVKVGRYDTTLPEGNISSIDPGVDMWTSNDGQVPPSVCSQSCLPGFRQVFRRGQPICCFECVTCPQGEISNQTDSLACMKCPWDQWPSGQKDKCSQKEREFLSYEETLGAVLAATTIFSSSVPAGIFGLFFYFKKTPVVRANNFSVSCLLLGSLCLCFLCSLTFIGYPVPEKCFLRQATFGLAFSFCVSCILAKTTMVVFAFMATKPGSGLKKLTSPWVSYTIITLCTFLQFTLCVLWMALSPPFPEQNVNAKPGVIIVQCNEGSVAAFWCMLGYLGLLATISFVVAFLARRLPDSFNEAKYITLSMLAFLSVWISFIPAYLSASGKYTVAMEIFAIQSSSWALVACMFIPKIFIVLFRPEMNSREYLMGKIKKSPIEQGERCNVSADFSYYLQK